MTRHELDDHRTRQLVVVSQGKDPQPLQALLVRQLPGGGRRHRGLALGRRMDHDRVLVDRLLHRGHELPSQLRAGLGLGGMGDRIEHELAPVESPEAHALAAELAGELGRERQGRGGGGPRLEGDGEQLEGAVRAGSR